jgi:hypothetical protein
VQDGIHNIRDSSCRLYSSCSSMMQGYMVELAYLGVSVQNFMQLGGCVDFFTSLYFESCIWPDAL